MADMPYGQFSLRSFVFSIEDIAYEWPPSKFARLDGEDGVKGESVRTAGLARQVVVPRPFNSNAWYGCESQSAVEGSGTATDFHPNLRMLPSQAWQADWQEAVVSACMRDHLYTLYTLQKPFWIQFDDEMSHDCSVLDCVSTDRKSFATPTYPVAFYRVADPNNARHVTHSYMQVYLNGELHSWDSNPWRFDPEMGLIVFENSIAAEDVVGMKYLWRAHVVIREINFEIAAYAQGPYRGTVVFEQIPAPASVERFELNLSPEPCRTCPGMNYTDRELACVDAVGPAVVASVTRTGGAWSWTNPSNAKVSDNTRATAQCTNGSTPVYNYLYATQFNFPLLPNDEKLRKITAVSVVLEAAVTAGTAFVDTVRLTLNGQVFSVNMATGAALSVSENTYAYAFALAGEGVTYDDVLKGRIGVVVGMTSSGNSTVSVDAVSMAVCYENGIDEFPLPVPCGCSQSDKARDTEEVYSDSCTAVNAYERMASFSVPTGNYVHGVDVASLVVDSRQCPIDALADVSVRMKLKRAGSTYSSLRTKSNQPAGKVDHAIVGYLDATSDVSFGGVNDLWGKPFGAWTPAMVNSDGLEFDVQYSNDCDPSNVANWAITYVCTGQTTSSAGLVSDPIVSAWGSSPQGGWREYSRSGTPSFVLQQGIVKAVFTWIGAGTAPSSVAVAIYSQADARALDGPGLGFWDGTVDNGFGDAGTFEFSNGYKNTLSAFGSHSMVLAVVGGVAEYEVSCSAYSAKSVATSGGLQTYAGVYVSATIAPCQKPTITQFVARVHHSPVCNTGALCYRSAEVTGSWPLTLGRGEACATAVTSDAVVTGAFTLNATDFDIELLGGNSRIVGILVTGEHRRVGSASRVDLMTVKAHIGAHSGGRTGKTLAYATSTDWTAFSLGGNGDFWDYASVFAETGVSYPTALGSEVNSYFHLEVIGANVSGAYYELRNVKVTLFFADVCDGL